MKNPPALPHGHYIWATTVTLSPLPCTDTEILVKFQVFPSPQQDCSPKRVNLRKGVNLRDRVVARHTPPWDSRYVSNEKKLKEKNTHPLQAPPATDHLPAGDYHDQLLRGRIVNRTHGTDKNVYIYLFLPTIFGPIYCGSPY